MTLAPARPSVDKLAPQAVEAEQSVLGSILIDAEAILRVADFLKPADFYRAQHGDIYEAMLALHGQREPIDLVTLADELERRGRLEPSGGPGYLADLMNAVPTAVHAEHYGRIVERKAVLRNIITAAGRIAAVGYEEANDAEAAIDRAEAILFEVSQHRTAGGFESLSVLLGQAYDRLEYLHEHRGQILGIPSGLSQLDALLGGFQPSDLVVLAARPSVGKTSLALNIAQHAAVREAKKIAVFSLEMSKEQLALRLLSAESGINPRPLQTGFVDETDWSKIARVMNDMASAPMWIDDSPALSVMELRTKARRLEAEQHGVDMIIVDYLQLMQASTPSRDGNRVQEVSEISRGLKQLARELKVPVIALSQLSRSVEQRNSAEPRLSDLRESGCLTADTRILRADTGAEVSLGQLLESGERNIPVWSVDHSQKLVQSTMTHVFPSGTKPVFLLRLASGRQLRATANHKFLAFDGWSPLAELTVGTRIAVPRRLAPPTLVGAWPEPELVMLAHLLGDGCVAPRQPIHYTSNSEENLVAVELAAAHFGITPRRVRQGSWCHVYLPAPTPLARGVRNPIAKWLDGFGLYARQSYEKYVPDDIFRLSDRQIATFLKHVWATDGSISGGSAAPVRIYYASTSRRLVDGIQMLLLRLDIRSKVRTVRQARHRDGYTVDVAGAADQRRFLDVVGAFGPRKVQASDAADRLALLRPRASDTIPRAVWGQIRAAMEQRVDERVAFLVGAGASHKAYRSPPSRQRLAAIAAALDDQDLALIADSDISWDEIVEIRRVGEEPVFDATVLETHNFLAEGIVSHNSIEQDSDVVIFLYREAEQNPDSEVELVKAKIAKHRNGPIGEVPLQFRKANTRFYTVATHEDVAVY